MALYDAENETETGETLPGVGVKLSSTAFFIPDIIFIRAERGHIVGEEYIAGAPDLIVEVPSPTTSPGDLMRKRALYQLNAIPEIWFVYVYAERIEAVVLENERYVALPRQCGHIRWSIVPSFGIDVDKLFARSR